MAGPDSAKPTDEASQDDLWPPAGDDNARPASPKRLAYRNFLIVSGAGVGLAALALVALYFRQHLDEPAPATDARLIPLINPPPAHRPGDPIRNIEAERLAEQEEYLRDNRAEKANTSFFSTFGEMDPAHKKKTEEPPPRAVASAPPPTPKPSEAMLGLMRTLKAPAQAMPVAWYERPNEADNTTQAAVSTPAPWAAATPPPTPVTQRAPIKPGRVLAAVMETKVNSWQPGTPVEARIVSSEFRNAKLIGGFGEENEQLVLRFTRLVEDGAGGRTYPVEAFAVDPDTRQAAVRSDVDHHYLRRLGLLAAATFAGFYADALGRRGETLVVSPWGVIERLPSVKNAGLYAAGRTGGALAGLAEENARETAPEVWLDRGEFIGVMFL